MTELTHSTQEAEVMCGWGWMNGWGMLAMALTTLAVILVILVGVVLAVRAATRPTAGPPGSGAGTASAEQLLAERYARGEIDEQEYQQRLGVLRGARR